MANNAGNVILAVAAASAGIGLFYLLRKKETVSLGINQEKFPCCPFKQNIKRW